MGFLSTLSTVVGPPQLRAMTSQEYTQAFWAGDPFPAEWGSALTASGVEITPELAATLTAVYCAVATITYDLATLPIHILARHPTDEGKDRVRPYFGAGIDSSNGIRSLAYMLRYQPNRVQTAAEFFLALIPQLLLRERAYAEIVSGPSGFVEQLLPRHPDRVREVRLPSGRLVYRLSEPHAAPRYVAQEEMFTIRGLSLDAGWSTASKTAFGATAIGTTLAADHAAAKFFRSGMTAAMLATYTGGQMEQEQEEALHKSITRFSAGVDNAFGLMLVPDDVKITNLAVEPEKAQMMAAREWGVLDVARLFRIDPSKLMIKGPTQAGAAAEQDEIRHVSNCLRPVAYVIEQAVQRDLVLAKDLYFVEWLLEARFRGDTSARAAYYKAALEGPWMWPSEIRARENMNPDAALDALSRERYKPGTPKTAAAPAATASGRSERTHVKALRAVTDNAERCLRRERVAVEKLAKKHAADVEGWQASLRDFFADHATFVAQTMRLPMAVARDYAAQHGSVLEARGLVVYDDAWERTESDELAALALEPERTAA